MMERIKISAKNLGQVALDDFCPRCFWIKLKINNRLPWQIFPGIFSSIDAYTKRIVHALIDSRDNPKPLWLKGMGDITGYLKVPHWSKFIAEIPSENIILSGVPDDLLLLGKEANVIIPDYKTAKYTETQDKLLPMYKVQLNSYAIIADQRGIQPVTALYLIYMEPITDETAAIHNLNEDGFSMGFKAFPVRIEKDSGIVNEALEKTREIYELSKPPDPREGCKDCENLDAISELLKG